MVLSHGFWQSQFGGSRDVVGRTITLLRQLSAPGFHGLEVGGPFDVALPICASALFDKRNVESRGRWWLDQSTNDAAMSPLDEGLVAFAAARVYVSRLHVRTPHTP